MTNNIYLNYTKAQKLHIIVDRENYLNMYKGVTNYPIIMSVEGTYIKVIGLTDICDIKDKERINKWVSSVARANYPDERLKFYWRRQ